MKSLLPVSLKITFIAIFIAGFLACRPIQNKKEISYSIPYIKADSSDLFSSKQLDRKGLIPLYADQVGTCPAKTDLSAGFRAAWSDQGLWIFCQVNDDQFYIDTLNPSKCDALEIYLAPFRGSKDVIKVTVFPGDTPDLTKAFCKISNFRTSATIRELKLRAVAGSKRNGTNIAYKVLISLDGLGINPEINNRLAMQLNVNDCDMKGGSIKNQLQWYPVSFAYNNSFAMYDLVLTERGEYFPHETSKCYIKDNEKVIISICSNSLRSERLLITNNNQLLVSSDTISSFPATFSFFLDNIDPNKDTIRVFLNDEIISVHDLFNIPRIYDKLSAPGAFETEIRFFEAHDRIFFPPQNAILFIGSSSIRMWYNIKDYFPEKEIIQRGFGGSTAADVLLYLNRIALNYKPSRIVFYEGENDLSKGTSPEIMVAQIDSFISIVRKNLPGTEIFIISPKYSFKLKNYWNKLRVLNVKIKQLCDKYPFVNYIDIVSPMFDEKGILRNDIFLNDGIHLNEKGYQIWGSTIRKELGF